jgi:hypothetical protein
MGDHETDRTGNRQNFDLDHAERGLGTQENLGLAGPPGRLGERVADLATKWWFPWATLVVLVAIVVVVSITA